MAKKRPGRPKGRDLHRSHRMVRLPVEWHEALRRLAAREQRELTRELILALAARLRACGMEPPELPSPRGRPAAAAQAGQ